MKSENIISYGQSVPVTNLVPQNRSATLDHFDLETDSISFGDSGLSYSYYFEPELPFDYTDFDSQELSQGYSYT